MSSYAPFFFVAALTAGILGFSADPSTAATIVKAASVLFLVLFVISLVRIGKTN